MSTFSPAAMDSAPGLDPSASRQNYTPQFRSPAPGGGGGVGPADNTSAGFGGTGAGNQDQMQPGQQQQAKDQQDLLTKLLELLGGQGQQQAAAPNVVQAGAAQGGNIGGNIGAQMSSSSFKPQM